MLRAGLETADWITVDDTGARHRGANGVCTQIGNDNFAWFGTTGSKSRLNFLDLLRAGHTDYVINDAALEYMREHALAGTLVQRLATHKRRQFADEKAWMRHLEQPRHCRFASDARPGARRHRGGAVGCRAVQRSIHGAHGEDCTHAAEGDAMPTI